MDFSSLIALLGPAATVFLRDSIQELVPRLLELQKCTAELALAEVKGDTSRKDILEGNVQTAELAVRLGLVKIVQSAQADIAATAIAWALKYAGRIA